MKVNVFQYANIAQANWKSILNDLTPYEPKYTFYADFAIAEFCEVYMSDKNAIKNTYKNVVESWGDNIEAMTEIVLVLNHKIWSFYEEVDSTYLGVPKETAMKLAEIYNDLWDKAKDFIYKKFGENSEAMSYYFSVTD